MNNNAHSILVSAIASHGGKLAISDAYCKVYLAGYMVEYPTEKQLLISLKQLELPKALIAYLQTEIGVADLHTFIKALEQGRSNNKCDLAWGVDAWAAALMLPERVRRNIRKQCFPLASQQLNSDLSLASDKSDREAGCDEKYIPEAKLQKSRGNALFPLAAMALFGFMTFPLASSQSTALTERTLTLPTVLPKQVKKTIAEVVLIDESIVQPQLPNLGIQNTSRKTQRTKRFNSHIEAFLKQNN